MGKNSQKSRPFFEVAACHSNIRSEKLRRREGRPLVKPSPIP